MYGEYTKQALPRKEYRELLGTVLCVFNSNNAFIIENILKIDNENYNWFELIDKMAGKLLPIVDETITKITQNDKISIMFDDLVNIRNRIVHNFQITDENGNQYRITEELLFQFIRKTKFCHQNCIVLEVIN